MLPVPLASDCQQEFLLKRDLRRDSRDSAFSTHIPNIESTSLGWLVPIIMTMCFILLESHINLMR